jgi:hypothetical protein
MFEACHRLTLLSGLARAYYQHVAVLPLFVVQLWSTAIGVLLQTVRTHEADILTLSVDASGKSLYAAGIDHKVVCLQEVKASVSTTGGVAD